MDNKFDLKKFLTENKSSLEYDSSYYQNIEDAILTVNKFLEKEKEELRALHHKKDRYDVKKLEGIINDLLDISSSLGYHRGTE